MVVFILTFYTSSSNGHDRLFRCIEKSGVFAYLNLYTQTLVLYDQRCYVAKLPIVCLVTYRVSWSRVWSSPSHRKLTLHLKIRSRTLESVSQLYYYCVAFFLIIRNSNDPLSGQKRVYSVHYSASKRVPRFKQYCSLYAHLTDIYSIRPFPNLLIIAVKYIIRLNLLTS